MKSYISSNPTNPLMRHKGISEKCLGDYNNTQRIKKGSIYKQTL